MRNVKWLVAASPMASLTACVEMNGYPTTSYGGYPSYGYNSGYGYNGYNSGYGYSGYNSGYYAQPSSYYQPTTVYQPTRVVTQTRYVPVPVPSQTASSRSYHRRDSDGDGIPDRYDRDKNGDGIPDRYQRH